MTMGDGEKKKQPIILEGMAWKRRSGFGKYSNTVGVGSSWERRRFALTPSQLSYYTDESSKSITKEKPRGTLCILSERATITATYPGNSGQPAPYTIVIRTTDAISGSEGTKWKLCFDDRETQLIWLVALTDIVAEASVKEYNATVLTHEMDKSHHNSGGFHRLYEEGDVRLLDLVHGALLTGGAMKDKRKNKSLLLKKKDEQEGIEVVRRAKDVHIMDDNATFTSGEFTASTVTTSPVGTKVFFNDESRDNKQLPMEKLYQALLVVLLSLVYEKCAETSSSLLWQLVNVIILCICFAPTKSINDKKDGSTKVTANELIARHDDKLASSPERNSSASAKLPGSDDSTLYEDFPQKPLTKSMVGTELLKREGVPLSCMPSERFPKDGEPKVADLLDDEAKQTERLERPLTEDEMTAHLHERWAMSAPNVDLSGEWTLIADDTFKSEYDGYLKKLGFSGITRKVACSLIARTTELTKQSDNGRELFLKGTNPKGAWERTLTASGYPDFETHPERKEGEDYSHMKTSIKTADSEDVDAEVSYFLALLLRFVSDNS